MKLRRFFLEYTRPFHWQMGVAILAMLMLVGAQLLGPWIIRQLIALLSDSDNPPVVSQITGLTLLALGVYLLRTVFQFLRSYLTHLAGWGVVAKVRRDIYAHLQRLSLRFYEDKQTGQLMSRMINDPDMFERLIAHAIPDVIVNVMMLIGVSAVLAFMNWKLLLVSLIPVPLILLALRWFAQYARPAFRARQHELSRLNASLGDSLSGIREIKAFVREEEEATRINKHIDLFLHSNLKVLRIIAIFNPFMELAVSLGMIAIIYFGGLLARGEALPVEDLVAFFLYLDLFYQPIRVLGQVWEQIQEAMAGAERVAELLDEEPDVRDTPGAMVLTGRAAGSIRFNNVSFRYQRGNMVLEGIELDIPARQVVALVGATGVGKTTLISLIPRFYDVITGSITLDGIDIRQLELKSLRSQLSLVLQDVFLFHGTARENILFSCPDASDEEVEAAAKVANAHEFIMKLPDGYNTLLGERGVKLSGGQKQRLAIARAVLKDAPVLILDEATSAVDTETELLIQEALERLMVGRTTLIIAHRLSTVRKADKIVVLEGTGIAETGSHAELMERDGLYAYLNRVQAKG